MRRLATFALTVLFSTTDVLAGAPGFDCDKATAVMERLICADGGLASMDKAMATAFSQRRSALPPAEAKALLLQQRDWIRQRDAACPMPPLKADEDFTPQQIWQAAPCVAARYRDRLNALGIAPAPVPPLAERADFIHPFCLALTLAEDAPSAGVPLNACNKGNAHVSLSERDGHLVAEGTRNSPVAAYGDYQLLGKLTDGRQLFLTSFNYGGTGYFSTIIAVIRRPQADGEVMLSAETIHGGGDRCNGGIADATLSKGTLRVTHRITPDELLSVAPGPPNDTLVEHVTSCAICCIGTATYSYPLDGKESLASARIDEVEQVNALQEKDSPLEDRCLAKAIRASASTLPRDYTPDGAGGPGAECGSLRQGPLSARVSLDDQPTFGCTSA